MGQYLCHDQTHVVIWLRSQPDRSLFYFLFSRSIIIATGAEAVWLGAEGEDDVKGKGVSTCATCDGAFYEGKEVGVTSPCVFFFGGLLCEIAVLAPPIPPPYPVSPSLPRIPTTPQTQPNEN